MDQIDQLISYLRSSWDPATFFSTRYHTVVSSLQAYDAKHWIRFTAIIGGYLVFRPHIEAFFASFQKKRFEKEMAAHRHEEETATEARLGDGDVVKISVEDRDGTSTGKSAGASSSNNNNNNNTTTTTNKKKKGGNGKQEGNTGDWDDGWGEGVVLDEREGGSEQVDVEVEGDVRKRAGKGKNGKKGKSGQGQGDELSGKDK